MLLKYYHFNYLIQSFLDHAKGGGGGFLNFSDFLLYTQPCTCENVFTCVMGKCRTKHEIQTFKKKLEEHDIIPILIIRTV